MTRERNDLKCSFRPDIHQLDSVYDAAAGPARSDGLFMRSNDGVCAIRVCVYRKQPDPNVTHRMCADGARGSEMVMRVT